jgi:hypothetical protein
MLTVSNLYHLLESNKSSLYIGAAQIGNTDGRIDQFYQLTRYEGNPDRLFTY